MIRLGRHNIPLVVHNGLHLGEGRVVSGLLHLLKVPFGHLGAMCCSCGLVPNYNGNALGFMVMDHLQAHLSLGGLLKGEIEVKLQDISQGVQLLFESLVGRVVLLLEILSLGGFASKLGPMPHVLMTLGCHPCMCSKSQP